MATKKKMLEAAAGGAGGAGLDITEVFSTYLYTGTGATKTITNGLDLDGEGGLVWTKDRTSTEDGHHILFDTERGVYKFLFSNLTSSELSDTQSLTSFNSNGFALGTGAAVNGSGKEYVSWNFRKAPKFFDVVKYTCPSNNDANVSHNLGAVPAMIIGKRTDTSGNWMVWHINTGMSNGGVTGLSLNNTASAAFTGVQSDQGINSSTFNTGYVLSSDSIKAVVAGGEYVFYLFAHNDGDGEFGPDGDQDIIKCGSYTGTGSYSSPPIINLGFEPQWLMVKRTDGAASWQMYDVMRGATDTATAFLTANQSSAEQNYTGGYVGFYPTATGFSLSIDGAEGNASGGNYIYMAIRRGPLAPPEAGTEVFDVNTAAGTGAGQIITTGFPVDMTLVKSRTASATEWEAWDRVRGSGEYLFPSASDAGGAFSNQWQCDSMTSFTWGAGDGYSNTGGDFVDYNWRRAGGYFDVVAYSGSGSNRTQAHNLGVAPEMIWVKCRSSAGRDWQVYHSGLGATKYLRLNTTEAAATSSSRWNNTAPTSTVFSLGSFDTVNGSGDTYIAYLFASVAGVSKVGSYTGNSSSQNIDCGFTSGARFVLIKVTTQVDNWLIWDTARGISSGTDPYLRLNNNSAEQGGTDRLDPYSGGFAVTGSDMGNNRTGENYIFYAIA